ncbi:hypothetical protein NL676_034244 [Syzygium grande]|nr:hypothetical protein NL676_034244 [Syzygium grande]
MGKLGLRSGVARAKNERSDLSQRRSRPHCSLEQTQFISQPTQNPKTDPNPSPLLTGSPLLPPSPCLFYSKPRSLGGGGSVTEDVQRFIWDHCISGAIGKCHAPLVKNFLKKLILEIESNCDDVLDELYELHTDFMTSLKDENAVKGNARTFEYISFLFPDDASSEDAMVRKLVVPLHCSLNMLEGDTGCSIWPASLFLSEFILSFPDIFSSKICFEVGSGVDLVGIYLTHVKAPKVKCLHLPWECASESVISLFYSLGADVIYQLLCLPHLVHLLSILVDKSKFLAIPKNSLMSRQLVTDASPTKHPMAYISSVIRNANTNLALVDEANLAIADLTGTLQPASLLPYMQSYDRSNIRLFRLTRANEARCF